MATIINGDGIVTAEGTSTTQGRLRLGEDTDNGSNYVELQAPASVASNLTFTLPSADGTSGQFLSTNGSGVLSFGDAGASLVRSARTSNTILGTADKGTLIAITSGTFTQTFTAAATLGSGWFCYIQNLGTGEITLDPNGSETIDGLTSYIMYPNEARLVQCNGSNFFTIVLNCFYATFTATGTFTKPPGYSAFAGYVWSAGGGGNFSNGCNPAYGNGGGGGGGIPFSIPSASFSATETVTIGAGGAGRTSSAGAGTAGGSSSLGSLVVVTGGGAGAGGTTGGAGSGGGLQPVGSLTIGGSSTLSMRNNDGFAGASGGQGNSTGYSQNGYSSIYGGGGGGSSYEAGSVVGDGGASYAGGGGGGGARSGVGGSGGTSVLGGAGGAGSTTAGVAGTAPGGGGGSGWFVNGGNGARGEVRIWGIS